jgi:hypothetical protein
MQAPLHSLKPAAQEAPQAVPSQVETPFAGGAHAMHDVGPQVMTLLLLAQVPLQTWNPPAQAKPHAVPSQVATALAGGAAHAMHDVVPQLATLVLLTQATPHT